MENTISRLAALLLEKNLTCATAESCTGGLIGAALTTLPGSSRWYRGGFVVYDNEVKTALLKVPDTLLAAHGAVSEEVAIVMAREARRAVGADLAVSVTGVAGPDGGSEAKPVGTVWIGWATEDSVTARLFRFSGDRDKIRRATVRAACAGLAEICSTLESSDDSLHNPVIFPHQ